jgi:hypothetical protein
MRSGRRHRGQDGLRGGRAEQDAGGAGAGGGAARHHRWVGPSPSSSGSAQASVGGAATHGPPSPQTAAAGQAADRSRVAPSERALRPGFRGRPAAGACRLTHARAAARTCRQRGVHPAGGRHARGALEHLGHGAPVPAGHPRALRASAARARCAPAGRQAGRPRGRWLQPSSTGGWGRGGGGGLWAAALPGGQQSHTIQVCAGCTALRAALRSAKPAAQAPAHLRRPAAAARPPNATHPAGPRLQAPRR